MTVSAEIASHLKAVGRNLVIRDGVHIEQPHLVSVGDDVLFNQGVHVDPCGEEIVIGSKTHFAPYAVLYGPLEIGSKCAFAAHVVLASIGHTYDLPDVPFVNLPARKKKIVVEDNVWVGANAVIIQGVRIGTGSIIDAGAVVTHDVEPYSVMGGVPARLIRKRTNNGETR
jgi:galactoside O-acetyltransferase